MFFKRVIGLVAAVGMVATLAGCGVNTIPTKEENAKQAWSQVQVAYQSRTDLIDQLVPVVKGAAANERATLTQVIEARASATKVSVDASTITDPEKFKQFEQAQNGVGSALGRLMVIQEQYPDLKSNERFADLMVAINGSQQAIKVAQRDYNMAAQDYNTTLRTFPSIIWAKTMYSSAKPMAYFTSSDPASQTPGAAATAPKIDMSDVGAPASK